MSTDHTPKNGEIPDRHNPNFLAGGNFRWKKSQAQIREELIRKIRQTPLVRTLPVQRVWTVAAGIILLAAFVSFLRFYSSSITVPAGVHQTAVLPDGSEVKMNAESSLTYYPFWWPFERKLTFDGEGFFNVRKGKKFTVYSSRGTTRVLGTSFNILSREEVYKVTCITGKVSVSNSPQNKVILLPNSQAEILANGTIRVNKEIDVTPEISWKNDLFLFTATPLRQVFKEIERQYAVTIQLDVMSHDLYTGNFNRSSQIEEVLGFVCPAAGLKFERKSAHVYLVSKDTE